MSDQVHNALQQVLAYHQRSKHHLHGFARSLGYLDWATQPDPFRRFTGAPGLPLALAPLAEQPHYDALFRPGAVPPQPLDHRTLSQLFQDSLALSAWKQTGTARWSLRINPSSGNLHPTEGYLIAGPVAGLSDRPAVYHYCPFEHALERRQGLPLPLWQTIAGALPAGGVLIGLASIHWRESWKYGERAFRYCHHDAGHAIGTVTLAAAVLGWRVRLLSTVADRDLATLLCLHGQRGMEAEHPDCLLAVFPGSETTEPENIALEMPGEWLERMEHTVSEGTANRLSEHHQAWPVIDEVAAAVRYTPASNEPRTWQETAAPSTLTESRSLSARRLIHQRRSAVAMDGRTEIDKATFYHILARVSPRLSPFPFRVLPWRPRVSLAIFVHRVRDLEPGLYLLIRDPVQGPALRTALRREFAWAKPRRCPEDLELYLLEPGDARQAARVISCHQEIAADGVFSLGMLAQFEASLKRRGASFYPRLFWETGLIGQVLYLEAEAAGIRATGIGCFFDDAMHQLLGIEDIAWQSLYHFTVGGAVDDPRLQTLDPYFHRQARRPGPEPGSPENTAG